MVAIGRGGTRLILRPAMPREKRAHIRLRGSTRQHDHLSCDTSGRHSRAENSRRLPVAGCAGTAFALLAIAGGSAAADAESTAASCESLEDAWWTGPLLAPNAGVGRPGQGVVEPYFSDVIADRRYDAAGIRRAAAPGHSLQSEVYLGYGVREGIAVGLLPRFGYMEAAGTPNSSSPELADLDLRLQYALTTFREGKWVPDTGILLTETLPTGRYDRLGRQSDGLGAGVVTTALSWLLQDYLWLRNGRIARIRLAVTYSLSGSARLQDASVYGTTMGFRGHVHSGESAALDAAAEYSLTRQWVIATDLVYRHADSTHITGIGETASAGTGLVDLHSGASEHFAVAPALEFNWSRTGGLIMGVQVFLAGRNTAATVTPMVAVNYHY